MKCNVLVGVLLWDKPTFIILFLEMGNEKQKRTQNNNLNGKYYVILKNMMLISVFQLSMLFNSTFYFTLLYLFFYHILFSMYLIAFKVDINYQNYRSQNLRKIIWKSPGNKKSTRSRYAKACILKFIGWSSTQKNRTKSRIRSQIYPQSKSI